MKRLYPIVVSLALLSLSGASLAGDDVKPYKDGPVTSVGYVKTRPGRFDDYMAFLATTYKTEMEAYKKAGLITGYAIYTVQPRTPSDPDLILTMTYANMAALDRTTEFDAVDRKVLGTVSEQNKAMIDRGPMRDLLGGELIREQILK